MPPRARRCVRVAGGLALPAALVALALASGGGSSQEAGELEPGPAARREQHATMLADRHGRYGPADGGGSARVVAAPDPPATRGGVGRYQLEYAAGPLGIAAGGAIFLQVSPFWGWSDPQFEVEEAPGFTRVTTAAPGVTLALAAAGSNCLRVGIEGAALPAGATVAFDYGAGPRQARVDSFAEAEEAFYFWVDGDGDGTRRLLGSDPHVAIAPGPAVGCIVTAPTEVAAGADFEVTLAFLDAASNLARPFAATVALDGDGLALPTEIALRAEDRARTTFLVHAGEPGLRRVRARVFGREEFSNPILVSGTPRRVLWADLHGHSQLSDGTGTPEDYYDYARHVAGLDVAVLTDHDHWGLRKLDDQPELWERIRRATAAANEPGRFTTLLGYEWTSWLWGHRHVLYFDGEGEVLSSLDPGTDSPSGLWRTLRERGRRALTVPHHPAGGPVAIDWRFPPDPELEPVVEITSVHGTSEEPRGPRTIYSPVAGHFVRDALRLGYQLGFVGSGDTHNGHPGLGHLGQPCGGVAAILATENTRDALHAALRARTCWATTGPRIALWFRLGNARMGAEVPAPADPATGPAYSALAIGTAPIRAIEFVKNGAVAFAFEGDPRLQQSLEWRDEERRPGDFVYLRVTQVDGHAAWASPIFTR